MGKFCESCGRDGDPVGESAALLALREGEKHGIREYKAALVGPDVMEEAKDLIRETLLPRLESHLPLLQEMKV